ncbi:MAG: hypothetical protein ACK5MY_07385 [Jhaorihella sp.]
MFDEFDQDEKARLTAAQRKAQDFDDLQNEIAGRETGRASRFVDNDRRAGASGKDRDAARDQALSALQQLLQDDPEYAALYNDTMGALAEAENATEIALEKALERQRVADSALADLRDNALTLEDGRRIYPDAAGAFRFEDGSLAEDLGVTAEQWHPGMPGYEEFVAGRDAATAEAETVNEIMRYQVEVLGDARDRLSDEDNPPSADELRDIQTQIDERLPPQVRVELEGPITNSPAQTLSSTYDIPTL